VEEERELFGKMEREESVVVVVVRGNLERARGGSV